MMLSGVICIGQQRERGGQAIRSLLRQPTDLVGEVLVFDCAPELARPTGCDDPRVRWFARPTATSFAALRAEGTRLSRGEVVCFMEEHALALTGWAHHLAAAFEDQQTGAAVGAVYNPNYGQLAATAYWLLNYGQVAALPDKQPACESRNLPGHNIAYRRSALLALGTRLDVLIAADFQVLYLLAKAGYRCRFIPEAAWAHRNEATISDALPGFVAWHTIFMAERSRHWSVARRIGYSCYVPLIPLRRVGKIARYLVRWRPDLLFSFGRSMPIIVVVLIGSVWGMLRGLWRGVSPADEAQMLETELNIVRAPLSQEFADAIDLDCDPSLPL